MDRCGYTVILYKQNSPYRSNQLAAIDLSDTTNPCLDGHCGQVIITSIEGYITFEKYGTIITYWPLGLFFMDAAFNHILTADEILNSPSDPDGENNQTIHFQIRYPIPPGGGTPPSSLAVTFQRWTPNRGLIESSLQKSVPYVSSDSIYDYYQLTFPLDELRGTNNNDGINEIAYADGGYLTDTFKVRDTVVGYKERGIANRHIVRGESAVYNLIYGSEKYGFKPYLNTAAFKIGGIAGLKAKLGGVSSRLALAANQADVFYFSGHGKHKTAKIRLTAPQEPEEWFDPADLMSGSDPVYWNTDMDIAIFSACSILDIKNYRAWTLANFDSHQYDLWNDDGGGATASPGDKWKNTGPTYFLGYNWKSPNDETFWGAEGWGTKIAERFARIFNVYPDDSVGDWEYATYPLETEGAGSAGAAIQKPTAPSIDYKYSFWDQCTDPENDYIWYTISQEGGAWVDKKNDFWLGESGYCSEIVDW